MKTIGAQVTKIEPVQFEKTPILEQRGVLKGPRTYVRPFYKKATTGIFWPISNIRAVTSNLLGVTPPNFCGVLMRFWTTFLNFFENFLTTHVGARGHTLYKTLDFGG